MYDVSKFNFDEIRMFLLFFHIINSFLVKRLSQSVKMQRKDVSAFSGLIFLNNRNRLANRKNGDLMTGLTVCPVVCFYMSAPKPFVGVAELTSVALAGGEFAARAADAVISRINSDMKFSIPE